MPKKLTQTEKPKIKFTLPRILFLIGLFSSGFLGISYYLGYYNEVGNYSKEPKDHSLIVPIFLAFILTLITDFLLIKLLKTKEKK